MTERAVSITAGPLPIPGPEGLRLNTPHSRAHVNRSTTPPDCTRDLRKHPRTSNLKTLPDDSGRDVGRPNQDDDIDVSGAPVGRSHSTGSQNITVGIRPMLQSSWANIGVPRRAGHHEKCVTHRRALQPSGGKPTRASCRRPAPGLSHACERLRKAGTLRSYISKRAASSRKRPAQMELYRQTLQEKYFVPASRKSMYGDRQRRQEKRLGTTVSGRKARRAGA